MTDMEYRAYIRVPGLDVESVGAERLLSKLEVHHGEMGPVLSGGATGLDVVLAIEADNPSTAAEVMYTTVADSLRLIGEADLYPQTVEIEPVSDPAPVPA